jgi:hypothetical protein
VSLDSLYCESVYAAVRLWTQMTHRTNTCECVPGGGGGVGGERQVERTTNPAGPSVADETSTNSAYDRRAPERGGGGVRDLLIQDLSVEEEE